MILPGEKPPATGAWGVKLCATRLAALLVVGAMCAAALLPAGRRGAMNSEELRRLFEAGDYRQVQSQSQEAVAAAPQDPAPHYWLARSSYELGVYDLAVRAAEDACRLNPQSSDFQMWLGRAYGRKAEIESSFFLARKTHRALETAVKLDGTNIAARRNLVEYYVDAPWFLGGSKEKARQQVEAITALDPFEGMLAMADYYRGSDQRQEAQQQYETLLEKHPTQVHFYLEALDFYEHERDALNMARVLDVAHTVAPGDPRLLFYRAVSRVIGGLQLDQAEAELKQFLAVYPGNSDSVSQAEGRDWLGGVYEKEGKWQQALEQYRQAAQLEPYRKRFRKAVERMEKEVRKQGK
ncbi:MAG TPA: tetratricopeptide repeat protein [Candidatus Acidoferrales bacterium]|nr:tetratricopeptide repeat protein [Candidatus Acidoferrales bacterium]